VVVIVEALAHFEVSHSKVVAHTHFLGMGKAALSRLDELLVSFPRTSRSRRDYDRAD
jgi:hypothetical protein